ncbi:uncharacterized protein LOC129596955 [Paramacrobiotus metropolitanus]|uniref:uncharacterized protein LOC129596955 n=1 Tax=Paramacrobiotus metropolitanus TaxID=2943436 RepID=UPI00244603B7|nr:uncharacterized protein LOC129596955 [Paramacrobiotus metropolitanus]
MAAPYGMMPVNPPATNLHNRASVLTFGILQLIFGVAMIISDIVSFCIVPPYRAIVYNGAGSGFYLGVFYIIAASFGIAAGRYLPVGTLPSSRKCLLITSMVLSILASLWAISMAIVYMVFLIIFNAGGFDFNWCYHRPYGSEGYYQDAYLCYNYWSKGYGFLSANLTFQALMFIFSLGQSISAGINMCKLRCNATVTQVVFTQPGYYPATQPITFNSLPVVPGQQPAYVIAGQQPVFMGPPPMYSAAAQPAPTSAEQAPSQKA